MFHSLFSEIVPKNSQTWWQCFDYGVRKKLEFAIGNRYTQFCQKNEKKREKQASEDRWWTASWITGAVAGIGVGAAAVFAPYAIGAAAVTLFRIFAR